MAYNGYRQCGFFCLILQTKDKSNAIIHEKKSFNFIPCHDVWRNLFCTNRKGNFNRDQELKWQETARKFPVGIL